ncbi:MAG: alpha/beta fold hydrolase [Candidatus Thorarchaeota archaeon]
MTELYADVNGLKICYEERGSGDPVILIHGFGVKKEEWIAQFVPLSEHFRVIRLDNRGAGKSDRPNEPYLMEMFADDVVGLMDYLEIDKAHVIGWSLGGMIAEHVVIRHSDRVKKLILINTMARWPPDKSGLELYKHSQLDRAKARLKNPEETYFNSAKMGFTRQFLKEMKADPNKKFYDLWSAEDMIKQSQMNPSTPQDIINQVNALGHMDVLDDLHKIKNKTLIMCAEKDRQMPFSVNQLIHENIPNSEFIMIKGAAHNSPQEKAPEINKIIIDFLKKKIMKNDDEFIR